MELRVDIQDARSGHVEVTYFRHSPIRVGRNTLNDLVLDEPTLSSWHAQLSFDDDGIWVIDVGSTNGSVVNGARLAPSEAIWIDEGAVVQLGGKRLTVSRQDETDSRRPRRNPLAAAPERLLTAMTVFDVAPNPREAAAAAAESGERATVMAIGTLAQLQYLRAAIDTIAPARKAYMDAVASQLDAVPPLARGQILTQLVREYPDLARSSELAALVARHGLPADQIVDPPARKMMEDLLGQRLFGAQGEDISDARVLSRAAILLQTFADALVELLRSRAQVASELGMTPGSVPASGKELLASLLDFKVDGTERSSMLIRHFADLATTQLGLVSATREGVRAILDELTPEAVQRQANAESGGIWDMLPENPWKLWKAFLRAHSDLREGDRFSRVLFGPRFQRAFLSVAGRQSVVPPPVRNQTTVPERDAIPVTRMRR
jgi:predicted component of type VI protein secretion system